MSSFSETLTNSSPNKIFESSLLLRFYTWCGGILSYDDDCNARIGAVVGCLIYRMQSPNNILSQRDTRCTIFSKANNYHELKEPDLLSILVRREEISPSRGFKAGTMLCTTDIDKGIPNFSSSERYHFLERGFLRKYSTLASLMTFFSIAFISGDEDLKSGVSAQTRFIMKVSGIYVPTR